MKAPDDRTGLSVCIPRRFEAWGFRRLIVLLFAAAFLIAFPADIRLPKASEGSAVGLATAHADDDDGGDDDDDDDDDDDGGSGSGGDDDAGGSDDDDGGDDDDAGGGDDDDGGGDDDAGGGDDDDGDSGDDDDAGDRDDSSDRSDSDDRGGPEDRGASSRTIGSRSDADRNVVTQNSPAAAPAGQALGQRHDEPGVAPTDESTARARAMVEIARDLGAPLADGSDLPPISGVVTQEMLSAAERHYVETVQEAWEAHGFPWNDPEVLRSLSELDAMVSALESIMQDGDESRARAATDFNQDGFVDINDLWDAYWR